MTLNKSKISKVSMRNKAYEIIKEAIISGELKPDERIKDKDLSEQLEISRTPVREAMLRLEDEEFIISKPNSHTRVAPIDIVQVTELYHIVISLETLALQELIASNTTETDSLEQINAHYKKSRTRRSFKELPYVRH